MNRSPIFGIIQFTFFSLTVLMSPSAYSEQIFQFNPQTSKLNGSITYTVVGRYNASFEEFSGKVGFDERKNQIQSIYLKIKANTVKSKFATLDKIVRSKKVLDVATYPDITFRAKKIEKKNNQNFVTGMITAHGVTRIMTFPFSFKIIKDSKTEKVGYLYAQGRWVINRRDFNIIWNKVFDRGGVVIGDRITLDWQINAYPK